MLFRSASAGEPPDFVRRTEIMYALRNLIENAVAFSRAKVTVSARWSTESVEILVTDDGPGFSPDVIDQLGEPYVSTRRTVPGAKTPEADIDGGGMGLGFFIAKTLIERTGARLVASNGVRGQNGAIIRLIWPRAVVEPAD